MRQVLARLAFGVFIWTGCGGDGGSVSGPPVTGTVSGAVREAVTGTPIAGASVSLGGVSTTSSASGQFELQNVPLGAAHSLTVSAPGYQALTQSVEVKAGANTVSLSLVRKELFEAGNYLVYLPPEVTTYRGVFVVMMGGTVDTRPLLRNELAYYQSFPLSGDIAAYRQGMLEFARKNGFAVIGAAFGAQTRGAGAFAALINAMATVGTQSGHAELATAPFVLHGHSATACFAYEFASAHPDRTIGFIAAKTACLAEPGAAVGVPGYFVFGENDPQVSPASADFMRTKVEDNRARGALWAFAIEPGAGHAQVEYKELLFDWMSAVAALRLPSSGSTLKPVAEAAGWLADHATFTIARQPCFTMNVKTASWLPAAQNARDWQAMVSRGSVTATLTC